MKLRSGTSKELLDRVKLDVEKKIHRVDLGCIPVVKDISLRKQYVRVTIGNIEACNMNRLLALFPESNVFFKDEDESPRVDVFVPIRKGLDTCKLLSITAVLMILLVRGVVILQRLWT